MDSETDWNQVYFQFCIVKILCDKYKVKEHFLYFSKYFDVITLSNASYCF